MSEPDFGGSPGGNPTRCESSANNTRSMLDDGIINVDRMNPAGTTQVGQRVQAVALRMAPAAGCPGVAPRYWSFSVSASRLSGSIKAKTDGGRAGRDRSAASLDG